MDRNEATPLLGYQARQKRLCIKTRLWMQRLQWPLIVATVISVIALLLYRPDVGILFKRTWSSADYLPLPNPHESIRLLHLEPGSGSHRIECLSESIRFADKPSYSALSYTWGDSGRTRWFTVNGKKNENQGELVERIAKHSTPDRTPDTVGRRNLHQST